MEVTVIEQPFQVNVVDDTTIEVVVSNTGLPGSPGTAATIAVGTVTTGAAGSSATVTNAGTSSAAVLNFVIPRGNTGATGAAGADGAQGEQGPQGEDGTFVGDAGTITTGTVADARLSANVTLGGNTFSGTGAILRQNSPSITGGLVVGDVNATGSATPTLIAMDTSYGTAADGKNFKFLLYSGGGGNNYGFGVAPAILEVVTSLGGSFHFYQAHSTSPVLVASINGSGNFSALGTVTGSNLSGTNTGDQDLSAYLTIASAATTYQPLDSDLTAIAALTTTTFGRSLLTQADAAAARSTLGLVIGTDVLAYSASSGTGNLVRASGATFSTVNIGTATGSSLTFTGSGPMSNLSLALSATSVLMADSTAGTSVGVSAASIELSADGGDTLATLGASDLTLGNASGNTTVVSANGISFPDSTTQATAYPGASGFVPTSRTVNGQALSGNVTVSTITGNAGTATALATGRTLAITGDLSWTSPSFDGSGNVTAAGTLATVNSNVGSFGSSTAIPVVTVNAKGLVTAVSTASVSGGTKTIATLEPRSNQPPSSNFATIDTRNGRPVLNFDTTTQETAIWQFRVPEGASLASGLTVYVQWAAASATSGTVGWDVAFERTVADGLDIDGDSWGTPQTITAATVSGTSGITKQTSVSFSQAQLPSSLAAGDCVRVRIRRDVANDTATGDAQILQGEIRLN